MKEDDGGLAWGRLIQGQLIRRHKRFLAEVRLRNNRMVTAHCPNTGSMLGCAQPGWPVWLTRHNDPKRKLAHTWQISGAPSSLVGINTAVPNKLVRLAAMAGRIPELDGYRTVRSEIKTSDHTRLDLLLEGEGRSPCYIEIKNCTLVEGRAARFPDAVTARGTKHLRELEQMVRNGGRAVIFYLVQRMDADFFSPADHIDPEYGRTLRSVVAAGVEPLAYDVEITLERIDVRRALPVRLSGPVGS